MYKTVFRQQFFLCKKPVVRFRRFAAGKAALSAVFASGVLPAVLAFAISFAFTGCPTVSGSGVFGIHVSGVDVTPDTLEAVVARGSETVFYAKVEGTDNQGAVWEILESGRSPDTLIVPGQNPGEARLTVARDEVLNRLTVSVSSAADISVSANIAIKIVDATVDSVTVEPHIVTVASGGSSTFTATVSGENKPSQEVKWDIIETGRKAGTVINDLGTYIELKVDENETLRVLTIRAASVLNENKFGVALAEVYSNDGGGQDAVVTGVRVSPHSAGVVQGDIALFTAEVTGTGSFTPNVGWYIVEDGRDPGTNITSDGILTVNRNEPLDTLTVRAISQANPLQSGTATVTVLPAGTPPPDVVITDITVIPEAATVRQGNTATFKATVTGAGSFDPSVVWSVDEEGRKTGTGISDSGVLTVAADETLTVLTVRATSRADSSRYRTAFVRVISGVSTPEFGTQYTVTLNRQDGSGETDTVTAFYGMEMPLITAPARTGYTFTGYWTEPGGRGKQYYTASGTGTGNWDIAADTTLYACWVPSGYTINPGAYTVTFESNGGTEVPAQTVASGGKVTQPDGPERDGFAIAGWYKDPGLTTAWDFGTDTVTEDITLYAKWTTVTYTVSFESNGGTEVEAQTVAQGGKVRLPENPVREGYAFVDWYKEAALTAEWDFALDTVTENITLYAKWTADTRVVSFDSNGGSAVPAQTVAYGGRVTLPPDPVKSGYAFVDWHKDAGLTTAWNFISDTVTEDITLYAGWTAAGYLLTYDGSGGTLFGGTQAGGVTYGETVTLPQSGAKTGYILTEFTLSGAAGGTKSPGDTFTMPAGAVTATAVWTPITYTVTYSGNGSTAGSTAFSVHTYDAAQPLTANGFTRTGYTFAGWAESEIGAVKYTDGESVKNLSAIQGAAVNLYAHWTGGESVVTFNGNGCGMPVPATKSVRYGELYGDLPAAGRTGYTFAGWWTASSGGVEVKANTEVTEAGDHTLWAHWEPITYIVEYNGNGSNGGSTPYGLHIYDVARSLTSNGFTKNGYAFAGWAESADGEMKYTNCESVKNLSAVQDATVTLYALWTTGSYTVTFNANGGGQPVPATKPVTPGAVYGMLAMVSKTNYVFAGWYTAASGGTLVTDETLVTATADHTLYARWDLPVPVTFDGNGGGTPDPAEKTVTFGAAYGTLATVSRTGYTFAGWYTAASGGTLVTDETPVTAEAGHTLYAQWTPITYTVTFELNGGSGAGFTEKTVIYGRPYGPLPLPQRSQAEFIGWYTADYGGNEVTEDTEVTRADNHTLYARWRLLVLVMFNSNGGGAPSVTEKVVSHGAVYGTLATVSRTGYTFAGWYTAASGGSQVSAGTTVTRTDDHTLYARWTTPKTMKVTYTSEWGFVSLNEGVAWYKTVTYDQPYGALPGAADFSYIPSGYTLGGWWTEDTGGSQVTAETIVTRTDDHEIYVHWTQGLPPGGVPVTSITFSPAAGTLEAGQSGRFTPVLLPANATNMRLLWTSGNTNVAAVDTTGRVTANRTGTAVITAQATDGSGVSGSYTLTVTAPTSIIMFSKTGGSGGTDSVTATLGSPMPTVTIPVMTNYTFQGYWKGDTQYYNADGTSARAWDLDTKGTMLSAKWRGVLVNIEFVSQNKPDVDFEQSKTHRQVYYMEPYGHVFPLKNIGTGEQEYHKNRMYFRWKIIGHDELKLDYLNANTIVTLPYDHRIAGNYFAGLPVSESYDIYE